MQNVLKILIHKAIQSTPGIIQNTITEGQTVNRVGSTEIEVMEVGESIRNKEGTDVNRIRTKWKCQMIAVLI